MDLDFNLPKPSTTSTIFARNFLLKILTCELTSIYGALEHLKRGIWLLNCVKKTM
jgi:hypothetical protein